jgi:hypothetical protein
MQMKSDPVARHIIDSSRHKLSSHVQEMLQANHMKRNQADPEADTMLREATRQSARNKNQQYPFRTYPTPELLAVSFVTI